MRTALTAMELVLLRCPIQWQRLYVAVHKPATLFSARLASVPTSWSTGTLAFNTGSPTSGTAPADMTVWIGSSLGAKDKGVLRLRSALTLAASGTMLVAELGEQAFDLATNDYLTIVEDIRPAARHIRYDNEVWYIDYGVEYLTSGSGNNYLANDELGPVARLGPPAIGFLDSGSCTLNYYGTRSAAYTPGKTVSAYAWAFPDGSTSVSPATTVTYTEAFTNGRYHKLTVTESDTGKTHVRYGLTYIFNRVGDGSPYDAALLGSLSGGPRRGGYGGAISILNTSAALTDFPDEAHVTVFAEDHWLDANGEYFELRGASGAFTVGEVVTGSTSGATGTVYALPAAGYIQIAGTSGEWLPGETITGTDSEQTANLWCAGVGGNFPYRQNVVIDGYIVGESITQNPETGRVEFQIATLDEMMRHAEGYPVALTNRSTTPTLSWEDSKLTTLNTATLHFMKWRSTIGAIADVEFAGTPVDDNVIIKYINFDKGTLWDQLNSFWNNTIFGWVAFDRQGSLYCEMDCNIDENYRTNTIAGHTLARTTDLIDEWELPRQPIDEISQYLLLGVAYRKPLGSKSPGDPLLYEGVSQEVTTGIAAPITGGDLSVPDQTTFNQWCGNLRARGNNPYRNGLYRFAGNWRLDVVPQHFMTHSISAGDTPRGLTLTNQRFVPRELRLTYNADASALLAEHVADAETSGIPGVTYVLPTPQDPEVVVEPPPDVEIIEPTLPNDADEVWVIASAVSPGTDKYIMWSGDFFAGGQPSWNKISLPSGYTLPGLSQEIGHALQVALDGSVLYLSGSNSTNSNKHTIWALTNIAAIRTTPATAPSWSIIAQEDDVVSIGTLNFNETLTTWRIKVVGATLYVPLKVVGDNEAYYSTYNGVSWTYTDTNQIFGIVVHKDTYAVIPPSLTNSVRTIGGAVIATWTTRAPEPSAHDIWCRYDSSAAHYVTRRRSGFDNVEILLCESDAFFDTGEVQECENTTLGGSWSGSHVFAHSQTGKIWIATSGVAFTLFDTVATGTGGRLMDAKAGGGGGIVRAQNITLANNTPIFLNKNRVAGGWTSMTGDWYSVWTDTTNNIKISSLMLTFL